jgi:site-specific DNA-methyltransferase (cytosine-N4-specific)
MFDKQRGHSRPHAGFNDRWDSMPKAEQMKFGSNMRNYWVLGPEPYPEAHFATFPREIPRRCILAGSRSGDIVLDPFMGSGTTGEVAQNLGRQWLGCELNRDYVPLQHERTKQLGMVL